MIDILTSLLPHVYTVSPTTEEMDDARQWESGNSSVERQESLFSFLYDGVHSNELLQSWDFQCSEVELDKHRSQRTTTFTDSKTGLQVRNEFVNWKNYPTIEWTAYFKNTGDTNTPILSSIQAADTVFERSPDGEFVLHHHIGDKCTIDSFAPIETRLDPGISKAFVPDGGRPSNGEWPYYNLECPNEGKGVIIAIGWPGQWKSQFARDDGVGLHFTAGQELTHLTLYPGEEIRTPLIALQFYRGGWLRGQNIWRRWMLDHNFPKDYDKPLAPKLGAGSVQFYGFNCTHDGDIEFLDRFRDAGIQLSYWWMDAGWYDTRGAGWGKVGTWEADNQRFPNGLKPIGDRCHSDGIELMVWFEMERVSADTWLSQNHPEWIHGGKKGGLLKLDEPEVVGWVIDRVDGIISESGIDLYRSDFNIDPLPFWRANDAEDRQGITEIRYIEGYLGYWDELRRRHPGMMIDSCASGGRRDDLETMRRAIPILPTDVENDAEAYQCCTYGFGLWLPFFDHTNYERFDDYYFRSSIAPFMQCNWDVRNDDFDVDAAQKSLAQWRNAAEYFFGDFWPLSAYNIGKDVWMAWQFSRPDRSEGMIQAFRRPDCPYVSAQFKLHALESCAVYCVSDHDTGKTRHLTGRELMNDGFTITISDQPGASLFTYEKFEV
ncbi:MAG: alpha-galactosidase [Candidatus Poribacteria bacterium]|nr:alpha-galactosidase [Candidatus Poribacteria bacterium]